MTRVLVILLGWTISFLAPAVAQFEGAIDMKVTAPDGDSMRVVSYSMLINGDKMMSEIMSREDTTKRGRFIFRGDRKLLWIINDDEKSYLEINLGDVQGAAAPRDTAGKDTARPAPRLKKTGAGESILGYQCEEYVVEEGSRVTHIWGTQALGNVYRGLSSSMGEMGGQDAGSTQKGWEDELAAMTLFPLRISTTQNGTMEESQEVTRIHAETVPASAFEPPAAYTKQSMQLDLEKILKEMQDKMDTRADTSGGGKFE